VSANSSYEGNHDGRNASKDHRGTGWHKHTERRHAAQDEPERNQVALELLRRDEKRSKGLSPDVSEAKRLPIALARLEHRRAKLLRRQNRPSSRYLRSRGAARL
jgi:hypothetical protein